jgi:hypothetical protein
MDHLLDPILRAELLLEKPDPDPEQRDREVWRRIEGIFPEQSGRNPAFRKKALQTLYDGLDSEYKHGVPRNRWALGLLALEADPKLPELSVGQAVGWETDPYAEQRGKAGFGDGFEHGAANLRAGAYGLLSRFMDFSGLYDSRNRYAAKWQENRARAAQYPEPSPRKDLLGWAAWQAGDVLGEDALTAVGGGLAKVAAKEAVSAALGPGEAAIAHFAGMVAGGAPEAALRTEEGLRRVEAGEDPLAVARDMAGDQLGSAIRNRIVQHGAGQVRRR